MNIKETGVNHFNKGVVLRTEQKFQEALDTFLLGAVEGHIFCSRAALRLYKNRNVIADENIIKQIQEFVDNYEPEVLESNINWDEPVIFWSPILRTGFNSLVKLTSDYDFITGVTPWPGHNPNVIDVNSIDEEYLKDPFFFHFVRNPYDRLLSCWSLFKRRADRRSGSKHPALEEFEDFNFFANYAMDIDSESEMGDMDSSIWTHVMPTSLKVDIAEQHSPIKHNYVARFENYNEELVKIFEMNGKELSTVYWSNREYNRDKEVSYRTYYSKDLEKKATKYFEEDLNRYNYEF